MCTDHTFTPSDIYGEEQFLHIFNMIKQAKNANTNAIYKNIADPLYQCFKLCNSIRNPADFTSFQ